MEGVKTRVKILTMEGWNLGLKVMMVDAKAGISGRHKLNRDVSVERCFTASDM
jgi:hypothetical protein